MNLSISETLTKANNIGTRIDRITFMREKFDGGTKQLLKYAYDPKIKWILPEGPPPYKPCPYPDQYGRLKQEIRKLYLFVEGGNPNLTKTKRESIFIQLLESIDPDDAKLLLCAKDRDITPLFNGITSDVVLEAFPGLYEATSSLQVEAKQENKVETKTDESDPLIKRALTKFKRKAKNG